MISFVVIVVLTLVSMCSGECGLEDTLCSLCKKRQPTHPDLQSLRDDIKGLRKDVLDLQKRRQNVAFFAYLSKNWNQFSKYKTLVYDVVDLNLGNGYDKTTGKFTAPVEGLYMFYVSVTAVDKSYANVELVLEGKVRNVGFADSGNHNDRTFVTTATPLRLKKGDIVSSRIGTSYGGSYIESNQHSRSSFSAVLL